MRRILCSAITISMLAGSVFAQTAAPRTYTLDFVTARPDGDTGADRVRHREAGFGELGRHFDPNWERLPLEMTLVQLDRTGYTVGDPVVYEVAIKHVGTKPLPFPMTRSLAPFDRNHRLTRQVLILLHIEDEFLGDQLLGEQSTAYSSDSLPQTFVMLNPGDIVRVRGIATWGLQKAGMTSWVRNVTVKAQLQFYGVGPLNPIDDSNGIKIQLQSR